MEHQGTDQVGDELRLEKRAMAVVCSFRSLYVLSFLELVYALVYA